MTGTRSKQNYVLTIIVWLSWIVPGFAQLENNTTSFDQNWRFHLGDTPDASKAMFDDSHWRKLNLPHDWSIEQPYDLSNAAGWQGGYLPGGIGWYRKQFKWAKKDGQVTIRFDGVYMNSEVWINGHYLGKRPYGYISFEYEISRHLKAGENFIAVRVDNSKLPSGRWYTGSGIYRHVWLRSTGNIYIPHSGTYIHTPAIARQQASVSIQTELRNALLQRCKATLETIIYGPDGKQVAKARASLSLDTGINIQKQEFEVHNPKLWSPETPVRYKAVQRIQIPSQPDALYTTYFGIRSIEVNTSQGFVLNGQPVKLKGVCNHHDAGPVGAAVPEDVLYRRLKLLKEMGCNAVRTTHNPAAPELYTICDTLGLMVLDEAFDGWNKPKAANDYGLYFDSWWKKDLTDFIKRDRNHPSVVMWSIGNEVPKFEVTIQQQLADAVRGLDATRPITQARSAEGDHVDVVGLNGEGEMPGAIEAFHQQHPDRPLLGTEITHTLQTRGVYATRTSYRTRDFPAPWEAGVNWENFKSKVFMIPDLTREEVFSHDSRFYQSSYDNAIVRMGVRETHQQTMKYPYFIGTFRWTGFDYLGEATIQPARTANFGILDLCGFPKDHYYLYQSLWSDKPMIHLLPHWTHPGKEGTEIPVVVYTNAREAKLLLNGRSLGRKAMSEEGQLVWMVPYQPGRLEAIAFEKDRITARKSAYTAGTAKKIVLTSDKLQMRSNGQDVAHVTVDITDVNGILVPEADELVRFSLTGPGKIIGVENGDITDFSSMKGSQRKAFKGKCLVMIQTTQEPGEIVLQASSGLLISTQLTLRSGN